MNSGRIKRAEPREGLTLPLIGRIKTGYKDDRGLPKSVDYFIPTGKYEMHFMEAYGSKADVIQVVFMSDDPREVCFERYEYRDDKGKLFARGDGETFEVWNGKEGRLGKYEEYTTADHPDIMKRISDKHPNKKGWEEILTLHFIVPKISGIIGYWSFSTKGEASTIPQIVDMFHLMKQQKGFVKGIIFDLSVQFAKSQKPGATSRYPVVSLVPNVSQDNQAMVKNALVSFDNSKLLGE